jgi:hypothetical protein
MLCYVFNHNFKYIILNPKPQLHHPCEFCEKCKEILEKNENDESIVKVYNRL